MNNNRLAKLGILAISFHLQAGTLEENYREVFARNLYTLNDSALRSGTYSFDGKNGNGDSRLGSTSIPATYFIGNLSQGFRPFVEGSVGRSDYREDNNRDIGGDIDFSSLYFKVGGGLSYTFDNGLTLLGGASILTLESDGDYTPRTSVVSSRAWELFECPQTSRLYDLYGSLAFHSHHGGYRPYLVASTHYLTLDYDPSDLANDHGWSSNVRIGFFAHPLNTLWHVPLEAEFYLKGDIVEHRLGELLGFDTALSGGTTLYWNVGSRLPWHGLRKLDITFILQGTVTDAGVHGHNIGLGLSLTKF